MIKKSSIKKTFVFLSLHRYDDMDDYPPPPDYPENYPDYPVYPDYYEEDYYDRRPTAYVPPVRAVVVHDYGHKKVDEPNLKIEPKKSEGIHFNGKPYRITFFTP